MATWIVDTLDMTKRTAYEPPTLRPELVALREDLQRRYPPTWTGHLTFLELQQYQRMMKRVNAADPFLTRATA